MKIILRHVQHMVSPVEAFSNAFTWVKHSPTQKSATPLVSWVHGACSAACDVAESACRARTAKMTELMNFVAENILASVSLVFKFVT